MRQYTTLKCDYCHKKFQRLHYEYKTNIKNKANYICCSSKCQGLFSRKRIKTVCGNCNKPIEIQNKEHKKSKSGKAFCCKSCAATYNNKIKKQSRRSKIESQLYSLLVENFRNLNILANDKTMLDGLEVDIAVPSLQLAIEWNGVVHFKPIYGQNKLNKVRSVDQKKQLIAQQKNINLIVILDQTSSKKQLQEAFTQISEIIKELQLKT